MPNNNPLLIDLGQRMVRIVVEGSAAEMGTDEAEGGVNIADRDDLETIAETWGDTETITIRDNRTTPVRTYEVKINEIRLDGSGDRAFWNYVLTAVGFRS